MSSIAHIRKLDGQVQPLPIHLKETQKIAEDIGRKLGIPHITGLAALLHDMGKYSDEFQDYIKEAYENPSQPPKRGSVNHSTAGGRFLMVHYHAKMKPLVECVANVIYGHHGQLLDMVNMEGESPFANRQTPKKPIDFAVIEERFFSEVCTREELEAYIAQAYQEFMAFIKPYQQKTMQTMMTVLNGLTAQSERVAYQQKMKLAIYEAPRPAITLLTKMVFSALIDADRTNSRNFDEQVNDEVSPPATTELYHQFLQRLEGQLVDIQQKAPANDITKLRQQMSDNCLDKATLPTGIYTLSIPTGGGKTLASLRFALKHALEHGKERIIYIVPYTTIIEQNAQEVRKILQVDKYVLEHHSNVLEEATVDEDKPLSYDELEKRRKLANAKDNWDIPIVFTTMVQYLDTFYSGKSRNERRLHNLSNAIVIFDEVQSVPITCVSLFNQTLNFLSKSCHTTILLCTATQPALEYVKHGIAVDGELIDNLPAIASAFKRTKLVPLIKKEGWFTADIRQFVQDKLDSVQNILIILNNKRVVKALYEELKGDGIYHLSTGMCVAHRKEILREIRCKLKAKKRVVCISTQLMEAGVDISFQCVIRSLAGLDSIAQAAGRCNRHGEVALREVYLINHAEESLKWLMTIDKGKDCTNLLLRDVAEDDTRYGGDLLAAQAMTYYFRLFYEHLAGMLNYPLKGISLSMYDILFTQNSVLWKEFNGDFWLKASFKTAAQHFEVIEANTQTVLVPYGKGRDLITQLLAGDRITDLSFFLKQLQQYSVNVFKYELNALCENGLIDIFDFGFTKVYIAKDTAYDDAYGLSVEGEAAMANLLM
ncbi:CRISPR-associated helicase Cas3' [Lysinibacillus piscis]|uniref:CRISPR-associated helicase/endonuclease Cas3 n=1 Tax=Lysinibacillus piscis TaxID=2518931 RepID=A0ABQ5NKK8_9BACI|nr:CRISPR-associated helicase Cas3' [Lysinibacillus sp. KH24]GLC88899.1 CRISPR-associated helicase/endonuclease Cas3 [Lysinibacillus sp. KH24]